jgi:hypothetical protein
MTRVCVTKEAQLPLDIVCCITSYIRQDKCIVCYRICSFQRTIGNDSQTVCSVMCMLRRDAGVSARSISSTFSSMIVHIVYISSYIVAHVLIIALWLLAMVAQIYMVMLFGFKLVANRVRLFSYFVAVVEWIVLIESTFHMKRRIVG